MVGATQGKGGLTFPMARRRNAVRLYWETMRHLNASQLIWRVRERLHRSSVLALGSRAGGVFIPSKPLVEFPPAQSMTAELLRDLAVHLISTRPRAWAPENPESLRLLNEEVRVDWPPAWYPKRPRDTHLWHFQLHYFDWIWDLEAEQRADLAVDAILDWIRRNKFGSLRSFRAAWHPYTISRRLPNWMAFWAVTANSGIWDENSLSLFKQSVAAQARYLSRHLEWEHRANHLLENLATVAIAEAFFDTQIIPGGAGRLLEAQLDEQILPGGQHFERSTLYHCRILDLLCNLLQVLPEEQLWNRIMDVVPRMAAFLKHIQMPDGSAPLLGDSVARNSPEPNALIERAEHLCGETLKTVTGASARDGHIVFRDPGKRDWLLFDAAPMAVDYNGAHAHADLGSVEIVLRGRQIISAGGSGFYGKGKLREAARAPSSHAVISVSGEQVGVPWKSFRLAKRGTPIGWGHRLGSGGAFQAEMEHNAFHDLGVGCRREVRRFPSGDRLWIVDSIFPLARTSESKHLPVLVTWPLHPGLSVKIEGPEALVSDGKSGRQIARLRFRVSSSSIEVKVRQGLWWSEFGKAKRRSIIGVRARIGKGEPFVTEFLPFD